MTVALIAAAGAAYVLVRNERSVIGTPSLIVSAAAETSAPPIYFRDPDGKPAYSLGPRKTLDGRDYLPVAAGEDIGFDDDASARPAPAIARPAAGERIKFYRNPMGLADTSPVPKKDSMGMDYIPVFEGDQSNDGSVRLSPGKIQRTGARSKPAARRVIKTAVRASGTIRLDERRVSVISMRAESWVQKVADVTTGSRVRKGQHLMDIYSPAVSSAAAEYVATITSRATATEGTFSRGSRQRVENLGVPETAIAEIERTRTVPLIIAWSAPRDGVVLERNAQEGMRAQPGDVLFRMADTSAVWATLDIAERDIGALSLGQPVTIRARGLGDRSFSGTIGLIYPQINRETRTARVRVELANADSALLPDMYVDASIDTGAAKEVVAVPETAILDTGSRQAVFVDKGEGRFEPRDVKPGRRGGGYVEVREGLDEGERVVVSANFLIDAESNLKAALKSFSGAESPR